MGWQITAVERQKAEYPRMAVLGEWIEIYDEPSLVFLTVADSIGKNPDIRGIIGAIMSTASAPVWV